MDWTFAYALIYALVGLCALGLLWGLAIALGIVERPSALSAEGESALVKPFSFVFLLSRERYLDSSVLRAVASKALGVSFSEPGDDVANFVEGDGPTYAVKVGEFWTFVNNFANPYFDEKEEVADATVDLRLKKAILEHEAWLSVDIMSIPKGATDADGFRMIGRLAAELSGDDCLAIYCPKTEQALGWEPEMAEMIGSEEPLSAFEGSGGIPVLQVAADDPAMLAAVDEARSRWPEFVSAFEGRRPDQRFSVKAPFSDEEHTEFMWIGVTAIEQDVIYGTLDNSPIGVTTVAEGDTVRASVADLNDWVYTDGEEVIGLFTLKPLHDAQERGQAAEEE